ncbi:MAG: hypothetical protein ACI8U4_002637 [Natronomonas sp.]
MKSLHDPEQLRDREDVPFDEETHVLGREKFEATRENVDSHVVVGVTNGEGEVLLVDDGSHGWTLAAFPADPGEDWTATARSGAEELTGVSISLEEPVRARRVDFRLEDDEERQLSMYNVVFRASPVDRRPVASAETLEDTEISDIGWFAEVPDEQAGEVAEDIRLFLA